MKRFAFSVLAVLLLTLSVYAQQPFNGLSVDQSTLHLLSDAKTRSICPENFTGEKGKAAMSTDGPALHAARDLGQGWKVSPYVRIPKNSTFTLAEIEGSGAIQQIWLTPAPLHKTRSMIIRFYWDGEETPSVESPLADFFACGWQEYCQNNSLMINVNPGSAFNCYWNMPFRKKAKVTIENLEDQEIVIYYQINYVLADVPENAGYFHAQFRRSPKLDPKGIYTIVDGIKGKGHYVGTYMTWEVRSPGWWGEGEIKFFMDGDKEFPTIAGTGTEDYFCGSYNFDRNGLYREFSTPYCGLVQVIPNDICYTVGQRFGLYRWHIADPIRFDEDLKVTIQALGWYNDGSGRYLPLDDDLSSVAFWYQAEPHAAYPSLPNREELQIAPQKLVKEKK
ncbi:MAG: glycoside hydrolase family 172 protein [Thermoguttaceae bacterium]